MAKRVRFLLVRILFSFKKHFFTFIYSSVDILAGTSVDSTSFIYSLIYSSKDLLKEILCFYISVSSYSIEMVPSVFVSIFSKKNFIYFLVIFGWMCFKNSENSV